MLGNLLMDVNKPSLWKNGAAGVGRVDGVWMVRWRWWRGGAFTKLFTVATSTLTCFHDRGLSLSVIWTKSLPCISRCKINSIPVTVLIRQSAIICELHFPPPLHLTPNDPACKWSCLLIISCIYNYRSTLSWQLASLHNDFAPFNLKSCQLCFCSHPEIRCCIQ